MTTKKISITTKPNKKAAQAWVENRTRPYQEKNQEKLKSLVIRVPHKMHQAIKLAALNEDKSITQLVIELITEKLKVTYK